MIALRNRGCRVRYVPSSEEYTAAELLQQSRAAERAGFDALWISDHFHPWNDQQGQSLFVWSVISAVFPGLPTCASRRGDLSEGAHPSGDRRPAGRPRRRPWWTSSSSASAPVRHPRSTLLTGGRRSRPGWRCWRSPSKSSDNAGQVSSRPTTAATTVEHARPCSMPVGRAPEDLPQRFRAEGGGAGWPDRRRR